MTNFTQTIDILKIKLGQNPDSLLFARLADRLLASHELDEAIDICERGIKKHPYYVTGHYVMGKCYLSKGLMDQAEKEFKRTIFFDPKFLGAHKYYAEIMNYYGWQSAEATSYQKILDIDPLCTESRLRLEKLRQESAASVPSVESVAAEGNSSDILEKEVELAHILDTVVDETDEIPDDMETISGQMPGLDEAATSADVLQQVIEEPPISEEEEEKFSYILDDIFRDESIPLVENAEAADNAVFDADASQLADAQSSPALPDDDWLKEDTEFPDLGFESADDIHTNETRISVEPEKSVADAVSEPIVQKNEIEDDIISPEAMTQEPESLEQLARDVSGRKQTDVEVHGESGDKAAAADNSKVEDRAMIVTPTLGEIYASQGQYNKAIGVFELLRKGDPDNVIFQQKIERLKQKILAEQQDK